MVNKPPRKGLKRVRDVNGPPTINQKKLKQDKPVVPPKVKRNLELAEQIKHMFASDGFAERSANPFDLISNDCLDMIMKRLLDKSLYLASYDKYCTDMKQKKKSKKRSRIMDFESYFLQSYHKLRYTDRRFADYFERRIKDVPKAEVGVRIQAKPSSSKEEEIEEYVEDKVIYSVHNGCGIIAPNICDTLNNMCRVLRFTRVVKHFILFGHPLNDHLLECVKMIDSSEVEAAHFYDIPYVDFSGDVRVKARELVNRFPKATVVDFNGVGFDYEVLFGDKTDEAEMLRDDKVLTGMQMIKQCLRLTAKANSLRGRRNARRAKLNLRKVRSQRRKDLISQIRSNLANTHIDFSALDDMLESDDEPEEENVAQAEVSDEED